MASGIEKPNRKRGRIILKTNSRRGIQQSFTSDHAEVPRDHQSWGSPIPRGSQGRLERTIQTRNQLKKEIFGQTFEEMGVHHYPTHSTPLHHTLHTLPSISGTKSGAHYVGATSSASSDFDEPDYQSAHDLHKSTLPLIRNQESQQATSKRHVQRASTQSPVHSSADDSSPLHQPIRIQNTGIRNELYQRKSEHNQVHPSSLNNSLLDEFSPPADSTLTRFNIPQATKEHRVRIFTDDEHRTVNDDEDSNRTTPILDSTFSGPKKLFSTGDSTISSALTPLLTSDLRKGGRKPSEKVSFEFDAEGQLLSCFPDRQIRVFIVTWNMQEQKSLPDSLDDLLLPLSQHMAADLFVIGTQESTPSRREWEVLVQQTLGPSYLLVHSVSLGIIYLTLYLRRDLIWFCSAVQSSSFATRPGTLIKTKGGVAISFTLFGTSFLFITSHFTAHEQRAEERNSDMQRIAANLSLCADSSDKGTILMQYDHVFWFGDLNYRVEMGREEANQCLSAINWKSLLLKDQLTREILQGSVFEGFSEQPISFPPSYKFDYNCDVYDSSEKRRVPSWTDRVLFKSRNGSGLIGCGYSSCSTLRISDHRPVYAVFKAELQPSKDLEGVPDTIVKFDRSAYSKAQQRRRQLAEEQTDNHNRQSSKHVSSSVCALF